MGKRQRRRDRQDVRTLRLSETAELTEAAAAGEGTIKVIAPGWGATGYYSERLLESDGPAAWPAGTHMYLDHPGRMDESNRPERSVRDLAGVLTTAAQWESDGAAGPGLYADVEVFEAFRPVLAEAAEHIGVSIRAGGRGRRGEANGRKGLIVEGLIPSPANSVDFVTRAGAGGRVLELVESARDELWRSGDEIVESWSYGDMRDLIQTEIESRYRSGDSRWLWVRDISDTWVVWEDSGSDAPDPGHFQATYSITDDGEVTLGQPQKVVARTMYLPAEPEEGEEMTDTAEALKPLESKIDALVESISKLTESGAPAKDEGETEPETMSEATRKRLEKSLYIEARDAAKDRLAESDKAKQLPKATRDRLVETAAREAVSDEALNLDADKLAESLDKSIEQAAAEFAEALGTGKVTGRGTTTTEQTEADGSKLAGDFQRLGLSESAAKTAAAGNGRR